MGILKSALDKCYQDRGSGHSVRCHIALLSVVLGVVIGRLGFCYLPTRSINRLLKGKESQGGCEARNLYTTKAELVKYIYGTASNIA